MKKKIIKAMVDRGWWKLAAHISPSLTFYYLGLQIYEEMEAEK